MVTRQVKVSEICLFVCFKVDEFGCHRGQEVDVDITWCWFGL